MNEKGTINKSHYVECLVPDCAYAQSSTVATLDEFIELLQFVGWIEVGPGYWICPGHSGAIYAHKKRWLEEEDERKSEV